MTKIQRHLLELQDAEYREFNNALIPNIDRKRTIGVRTPALRKYAKELIKNDAASEFMQELPHRFFEENQLHAFLISEIREYERCVEELKRFLPYVDNWATCDQLRPKAVKKQTEQLVKEIDAWLGSGETYTIRFGIGMLMCHYLDDRFREEYPKKVSTIISEEYYVNMMIAWYFATALAKQWDAVIPYIEGRRLDRWVHNKTIQKAVESRRINDSRKQYLRTLKVK